MQQLHHKRFHLGAAEASEEVVIHKEAEAMVIKIKTLCIFKYLTYLVFI